MVPLLLISVNYSAIEDFYKYSVPLNSLELSSDFQYTPERFEKTKNLKDSTCFTTLSMNEFCYGKPRMYGETGISYRVGNDVGFDGNEITASKMKHSISNMNEIFENKISSVNPTNQIIHSKWLKKILNDWIDGHLDDYEVISAIQYTVNEEYFSDKTFIRTSSASSSIPSWFKNNTEWWLDEKISYNEFIIGFQYILNLNIIKISSMASEHTQLDFDYFTIYDNNVGIEKPPYPLQGTKEIIILSGKDFWNDKNDYNKWSKIDWKGLKSKLDNISKKYPIRPIVLDIEGSDPEQEGSQHWGIDYRKIGKNYTIKQYENYKNNWIQLIKFVKNNYSGDVGAYAIAPHRDFWAPVSEDKKQIELWKNANADLVKVAAEMDFIAPSIYTFYDEPEFGGKQANAREKWVTYAEHNISEAKQYGKPVYVCMWGKFHPSNKILGEEPISKEFMEIQYQTIIQQDVENVIMWGKYNIAKNNVKNENWYQVLKENEYLGK